MQIEAKNNYVIIRIERKFSSIALLKTEEHQEKDIWLRESPAIILSVGPDVKDIKVGDRVVVGAINAARYDYLTKLLGDDVPENVTYLACKEENITAVLKD